MVAITLIASVSTFAQTKITGFGKLQLGMTLSELPELKEAIPVSNSTDFFRYVYDKTDGTTWYTLIADTTQKNPSCGSLDKKVSEYHVGEYKVTETISVKNVTLKFYDSKLISIKTSLLGMSDILNTKFGEGNLDLKEKDRTFVNGYGAKFIKTDKTYTTTWVTNVPNVTLESVLMIWYNDSGEKLSINYVKLENSSYNNKIKSAENDVITRIEKREQDKKKSLVSGF